MSYIPHVEIAREAAVGLVSRYLNSMGSVDTDSLRELSYMLKEKQELATLGLRVCTTGIVEELKRGRESLIFIADDVKELEGNIAKLREITPSVSFFQSMENTKLLTEFLSIYNNLTAVIDLITILRSYNRHLNEVERILRALSEEGDQGSKFEFCVIYRMLVVSRKLQNRVIEQAKAKSHGIADTEKIFSNFFSRLDDLELEFEAKYWSSVRCVLDRLIKGDSRIVHSLLSVIEDQDSDPGPSRRIADNGGDDPKDHCSDYKEKFIEIISASIRSFVNNLRQENTTDLSKIVLKGHEALIALLRLTEVNGDKSTPIFSLIRTCVIELHDRLHRVIASMHLTSDIPADSIMDCLDSFSEYRLALDLVFLQGSRAKNLLIGQITSLQNDLCERYYKHEYENAQTVYDSVVTKHLPGKGSGIANADTAKGIEHSILPRIESNLRTKNFLLASAAADLLHCILSKYYRDLLEAKNTVTSTTLNVASDLIPDGVEPALIGVCGNSYEISKYIRSNVLTSLQEAIDGVIDGGDATKVVEFKSKIEALAAQFVQLAGKCAESVCSVINSRVSPVKDLLFTAKWYESDVIQFAVGVLTDSLACTEDGVDADMKLLITHKAFKRMVDTYMDAISTKRCIFKKAAVNIIKSDAKALEETFAELGAKDAKAYTVPIHRFADLVSATKPAAIASACKSFCESYECYTAEMLKRVLESCANCSEELMESIIGKVVGAIGAE